MTQQANVRGPQPPLPHLIDERSVRNAGKRERFFRVLQLRKRLVPVLGTRNLRKSDMILNDYLPVMEVDPQTYEVRADGQLLTCAPASVLPLVVRRRKALP